MIIVMKPGATRDEIDHVMEKIESIGLVSHPIFGTRRTVIAAIGDKHGRNLDDIEAASGVERVVPILAPYKMASLEVHEEKSTVKVNGFAFGGKKIGVIAGPCTIEDEKTTVETAEFVKSVGAVALRGGAYKPRTSPYSFQGLEELGLKYLAKAREKTGLAVVTEVISAKYVGLVSKYADVLQIGARNMQNFLLLKAVGDQEKPVLLKRGMSATLDEFLFAAEYILSRGNQNVILCERGIRTFENHTRNTVSIATIPSLRLRTHLPVIVDPSHSTGHSNLVSPVSMAAVAAGADGIIVEVHPRPEEALVDGAQSLDFPAFEKMMVQIARIAEAVDRTA
ncbi:MAG: 3-deoxy-7-phosphoheptulonate synthase [Planctomycetes bacterium]|nr:3-deoxy-7-phosphoheptulonate synthase [Planctomycetota bacterium]